MNLMVVHKLIPVFLIFLLASCNPIQQSTADKREVAEISNVNFDKGEALFCEFERVTPFAIEDWNKITAQFTVNTTKTYRLALVSGDYKEIVGAAGNSSLVQTGKYNLITGNRKESGTIIWTRVMKDDSQTWFTGFIKDGPESNSDVTVVDIYGAAGNKLEANFYRGLSGKLFEGTCK